MMSYLTDKRLLIGVALGYFVGPHIAKTVRGLVDKAKGSAG